MITVKIGTIEKNYFLRLTSAPRNYDGFGTIEIESNEDERIILIDSINIDWQEGRYTSGMYVCKDEDIPEREITQRLWGRLVKP